MAKTKKSVVKRLKVSRRGVLRRRATALGHARANKRGVQMTRKKRSRGLTLPKKTIQKYI